MNNRALTLSLLMAVIAVFFVNSYVTSIEEETKKKYGTEVTVITASVDIQEMQTIDETLIEIKTIPKRYLEPAAISYESSEDIEAATDDIKKLAGTVALVPIRKGEQIAYNKITIPGIRTGLSPQIAPGKRGVTVPVNEVTGVGKLVKPGDRVDVTAIVDPGTGDPLEKYAKTLLQDVVVLAVGRNITNNVARVGEERPGRKIEYRSLSSFDGFSSVTLEVEPPQAQMLTLMMAMGNNTLSLTLRNNDDTDRVTLPGMTLKDVLGTEGSQLRTPASNGRYQRR